MVTNMQVVHNILGGGTKAKSADSCPGPLEIAA